MVVLKTRDGYGSWCHDDKGRVDDEVNLVRIQFIEEQLSCNRHLLRTYIANHHRSTLYFGLTIHSNLTMASHNTVVRT